MATVVSCSSAQMRLLNHGHPRKTLVRFGRCENGMANKWSGRRRIFYLHLKKQQRGNQRHPFVWGKINGRPRVRIPSNRSKEEISFIWGMSADCHLRPKGDCQQTAQMQRYAERFLFGHLGRGEKQWDTHALMKQVGIVQLGTLERMSERSAR